MRRDRNESGALLFGRFGEAFIKLRDVMIFEKAVGLLFCLDAVKFEFIGKPALKRGVHPFASATRLRGVGGDHSDPQLA